VLTGKFNSEWIRKGALRGPFGSPRDGRRTVCWGGTIHHCRFTGRALDGARGPMRRWARRLMRGGRVGTVGSGSASSDGVSYMARKLKLSMTAMASRMACASARVKASGVMALMAGVMVLMAWPDLPMGSGVRMVPVLATNVGDSVRVLSSRSALALDSLG